MRPLLLLALACLAATASAQVSYQPRMGEPIRGLTPTELALFLAGRDAFFQPLTDPGGRGPIFNDSSCAACHNRPLTGGSGTLTVTRFGKAASGGSPFDPLTSLGGSLLQSQAIDPLCLELVPPEADVTAHRVTPAVFGAGLVEAVDDGDILALAANPPPGLQGQIHMVQPVEGGPPRPGRFGWKGQVATLTTFSADAALNEMGLTSTFFPVENAPNGNLALLALFDLVPDPEDRPDPLGFTFVDRVTHFQRFLAAPPQTPRTGMSGEARFLAAGCGGCHVADGFTTPAASSAALSGVELRPYSDFLLHDMGSLGDGIVQGAASEQHILTRALWGLAGRQSFLHDGRVIGGSFDTAMRQVIAFHDGEAAPSAAAFAQLSPAEQDQLIAFLASLGRAEFDFEHDNDVDGIDWFFVQPLVTGPGPSFGPDATAAICDVDQDGDFDLVDFSVLQRAFTGQAPAQPEGVASASLDLRAVSGGLSTVTVLPGASVGYQVLGELTDATNEGLALFALDLSLPGVTLSPAAAPSLPLASFAPPLGFSNPGAFGGTPVNGGLVQVGGAQNTIRNAFAPIPNGTVLPGLALPGAPLALAEGTFTAPLAPGTYLLSIASVVANVIEQGQTGQPFWRVAPIQAGRVVPLTIHVLDCDGIRYCTAKTSSIGCQPTIASSGGATLGGPDDLHITATGIVRPAIGVLSWSSAATQTPFFNGILCLQAPLGRSPLLSSGTGGAGFDCAGSFDFHFSDALMAALALQAGEALHAQFIFRDPTQGDMTAVGTTDALGFQICP